MIAQSIGSEGPSSSTSTTVPQVMCAEDTQQQSTANLRLAIQKYELYNLVREQSKKQEAFMRSLRHYMESNQTQFLRLQQSFFDLIESVEDEHFWLKQCLLNSQDQVMFLGGKGEEGEQGEVPKKKQKQGKKRRQPKGKEGMKRCRKEQ